MSSLKSLIFVSSEDLQSLSMTAVDLCAMYKPWHVQEKIVSTIMDEFWQEVCALLFSFFLTKSKREMCSVFKIILLFKYKIYF